MPSMTAEYFRQYRAARAARGGRRLTKDERSVIGHRSSPRKETGYRAERRRRSLIRQTTTLRKEII